MEQTVQGTHIAVGFSPETGALVPKPLFTTSFTAAITLFAIALLGVILITITICYQKSNLLPAPAPYPLTPLTPAQTNYGGSITPVGLLPDVSRQACLGERQEWDGTTCRCRAPYYGVNCEREWHDYDYLGLGNPDPDLVQMTSLGPTTTVPYKSQGEQSCSALCNQDSRCTGFLYERQQCQLLQGPIVAPALSTWPASVSLPYSAEKESILYGKRAAISLDRTVVLAKGERSVPPRYWLVPEQDRKQFTLIPVGQVIQLQFFPRHHQSSQMLIGVYSTEPFRVEHARLLIDNGSTPRVYIHHPGEQLNLPQSWLYESLHVVYLPV